MRLAAGTAILSSGCFLLLLGGLARWLAPSVLLAGLVACWWHRPGLPAWKQLTWWVPFAPWLALYSIHAVAPEIQPDAITYHLALPAAWLRTGQFLQPVGHYEVMPHGLELLFAGAFSVGEHSAAKLVHFCYLVASLPLIHAIGERLGLKQSRPAAALYLTAPVAAVCGTSAYVDVGLVFFFLATFYLLLEGRHGWAGVAAGFCYAVKMTGVVAAPAAAVFLLWKRRRREAALLLVTASLTSAPWILRACWMSGNPAAPFANHWFPNPWFHESTEAALRQHVTSYQVPPAELPWELALGGRRINGLLGPVFLLAPVGLVALRRSEGRLLWAAAAVATVPWWLNHGTRFILPGTPFVALTLASVLPHRVAWIAVIVQGVACWPAVMDRWVPAGGWRLAGVPWHAALRLEPEDRYLRQSLTEYRIAAAVNKHVKPDEPLLDLVGIATAYVSAPVRGHWQYAAAERAAEALRLAATMDSSRFEQLQALWPQRKLMAIRVETLRDYAEPWAVLELEILHGDGVLFPGSRWELDAEPNPWETPLIFDRNPVSGWRSWGPAKRGSFVEVIFPVALATTGVRITGLPSNGSVPLRVLALTPGERWERVGQSLDRRRPLALDMRVQATRYILREGLRWIVAHTGTKAWDAVGRDLVERPEQWGLEVIASVEGVYLLRIGRGL